MKQKKALFTSTPDTLIVIVVGERSWKGEEKAQTSKPLNTDEIIFW